MIVGLPRVALSSPTVTSPQPSLSRTWGSGGLAALSVLACLIAAVLLTGSGAWSLPSAANAPVDLAVGLAYPVLGFLVVARGRGARSVGLLLLGAGALSAATVLAAAVALSAETVTPAARIAAQLSATSWVPAFLPLLTLLPLAYPDGLLPGRIWQGVRAISIVGIALFTVGIALYPESLVGRVRLEKLVESEPVAQAVDQPGPASVDDAAFGLEALEVRVGLLEERLHARVAR